MPIIKPARNCLTGSGPVDLGLAAGNLQGQVQADGKPGTVIPTATEMAIAAGTLDVCQFAIGGQGGTVAIYG